MTITIDASLFTAMCRELADKAKAPDDEVLREETGRVLSRAVQLTPAASVQGITGHSGRALFSLQAATLYSPQRPQRRNLRGSRVMYKLTNRYPDQLWAKLTDARNQDLKKRLAARGLAKQSWWKIGKLLGLDVDAPAYVQQAVAKTGKDYPQDESARTIREDGRIGYEGENSQPTINAIGGAEILENAMAGRIDFFLANMKKGVFDSMDEIARKYPGVTTHDG
jgi:hypothetical protein